jgi:hypothetical protein
MPDKLVSILIANYKTPTLTKVCLRLLRKYTDPAKIQVIVVDNNSEDESTQYLKSLPWIRLLTREPAASEPGSLSHSLALDQALEQVDTPYLLAIHTDTFVKHPDWLEFLLSHIQDKPQVAGVGSWKLENKPWHRRLFKAIEALWQQTVRGKPIGNPDDYYLRSHCALYRTDYIFSHQLKFTQGQLALGEFIHRHLVKQGYQMQLLDSLQLSHYIDHVNHATLVLNPQKSINRRVKKADIRRVERALAKLQVKQILADDSLDKLPV